MKYATISIPEEFGKWDGIIFSGRDPGKLREIVPIWGCPGCAHGMRARGEWSWVVAVPCHGHRVRVRTRGFVLQHPDSHWNGGWRDGIVIRVQKTIRFALRPEQNRSVGSF